LGYSIRVTDWFKYFWTSPVTGVPASAAFGLFSAAHLLTLAGLAIGIAALAWVYRRAGDARRRHIRLVIGIAVIAMEVARQISYILAGNYKPEILPLHLCAVSTYCVFIDALKPNSWTREFLYALGVWGAPCALLFPDWANMPLFNIYTWQSFAIHACLTGYALMLLVSGEFRPSARNLWKVVVIMAVSVAVSLVANNIYGTNFWFLNAGSAGSPLEPIQVFAGAFYLPVLAVMLGILWTIMYLPWRRRPGKHPSSAGR